MNWKKIFSPNGELLKRQSEIILQQANRIEELKSLKQHLIVGNVNRYSENDEIKLFQMPEAIDNIHKMLAYDIHHNTDSIIWGIGEMTTEEKIGWAKCQYYYYTKLNRIKEGKKETEDDE